MTNGDQKDVGTAADDDDVDAQNTDPTTCSDAAMPKSVETLRGHHKEDDLPPSINNAIEETHADTDKNEPSQPNNMIVEMETVAAVPSLGMMRVGNNLKVKRSTDIMARAASSTSQRARKKTSYYGKGSKVDYFAAKLRTAVDEAQSTDSDEAFVYDSIEPAPSSSGHQTDSDYATFTRFRHSRNASSSSLHPPTVSGLTTPGSGLTTRAYAQNLDHNNADIAVSSTDTPASSTNSLQTVVVHTPLGAERRNGYFSPVLENNQTYHVSRPSSRPPSRGPAKYTVGSPPLPPLSVTSPLHTGGPSGSSSQGSLSRRNPLLVAAPGTKPGLTLRLVESRGALRGSSRQLPKFWKPHSRRVSGPTELGPPSLSSLSSRRAASRTLARSPKPSTALLEGTSNEFLYGGVEQSHTATSATGPARKDSSRKSRDRAPSLDSNSGLDEHVLPQPNKTGYDVDDDEYDDDDTGQLDDLDLYGYESERLLRGPLTRNALARPNNYPFGNGRSNYRHDWRDNPRRDTSRGGMPHDFWHASPSSSSLRHVRLALWLFLGVLSVLVLGFTMGFLLATSKPLVDVNVTKIIDTLVSKDELVLDVIVEAVNPGTLSVELVRCEIDVFASASNAHKSLFLGSFTRFDSPLTFDGGLLSHNLQKVVGTLHLLEPGHNRSSDHDEGRRTWAGLCRRPFTLMLRGVVRYTLPLSSHVHAVPVARTAHIDPASV